LVLPPQAAKREDRSKLKWIKIRRLMLNPF